jgi:hypothetical protein
MAAVDAPRKPEPSAEVASPAVVPEPVVAQAAPLPPVSLEAPPSEAAVTATQRSAEVSSSVPSTDAEAPATVSEPSLASVADPDAGAQPPAQESKVEVVTEAPVLAAPPPSALSPVEDSASVSAEPTASVEAPIESEAKAGPPEPVELPPMPTGEMEVASNWESLEQGGANTDTAQEPTSPWQRRAIEVDFSTNDAGSTEADTSFQGDEVPLASVHEFIPTWQPSAEPEASGAQGWAGNSMEDAGTRLQFQEAVEALRQASTRGALGKALLSYCQGRYPRGYLLGETFGFARVGHAYGPGSDKYAVSALQVDLEAPSILASAAADGRPIVSSVPESQEDEILFGALGESFSHLMAAPIQLNQRTVGFVVIDGGPSPFGAEELRELEQLIAEASEVYGRLNDGAR